MSTVVKFTNQFTDGTTANVEVGPFADNAFDSTANMKTKIRAINTELANGATGLSAYLVSKTGAGWRSISEAVITKTERTYLY